MSFSSNINISPNRTFNNKVHSDIGDGQNQIDSTLITNSQLENDENNLAFDVKYTYKFESGNEVTTLRPGFTPGHSPNMIRIVSRMLLQIILEQQGKL